jgi:hypothetical protein
MKTLDNDASVTRRRLRFIFAFLALGAILLCLGLGKGSGLLAGSGLVWLTAAFIAWTATVQAATISPDEEVRLAANSVRTLIAFAIPRALFSKSGAWTPELIGVFASAVVISVLVLTTHVRVSERTSAVLGSPASSPVSSMPGGLSESEDRRAVRPTVAHRTPEGQTRTPPTDVQFGMGAPRPASSSELLPGPTSDWCLLRFTLKSAMKITVDGMPIGTSAKTQFSVDPGKHDIVFERRTGDVDGAVVECSAGEVRVIRDPAPEARSSPKIPVGEIDR